MARNFDGTADRIDYASVQDAGAQAQTLSLWAYIDSTPEHDYVFWDAHKAGDAASGTMLYGVNATSCVIFILSGATVVYRHTSTAMGTGAWVHILCTSDGSVTGANIHIYKNGVECGYSTTQNGVTLTAALGTWSLGGRVFSDTRNLDGKLAAVGWWNRVLTAGEIAGLVAGFSPLCYPQGLKFAPDLDGLFGPNNPLGGAATLDGTTIIAHPRLIYPSRRRVQVRGAAVGTTIRWPWQLRRHRRMAGAR